MTDRDAPTTLHELIADWAADAPDAPVIIERQRRKRTLTVGDLEQRSIDVASGLAALGLSAERPLAIWLPNQTEWVEALAAAARLGAAVIGINTRYKSDELTHILSRSNAGVLLVADEFAGIRFADVVGAADVDPSLHVVVVDADDHELTGWDDVGCAVSHWHDVTQGDRGEGRRATAASAPAPGGPDDLLMAFTTSGTTGYPKLAVHDQAAVVRHGLNDAAAFDIRPGDRFLVDLPLCGAFGFNTLLCAIGGHAPVLLNARFDVDDTAAALADEGVTHYNASDDMILRILATERIRPGAHRWREGGFANFTNAGRRAAELAEERLGVKLTGLYGASEAFALLSRWPPSWPVAERSRSGGIPVDPTIEVKVIDPDTGADVPHGAEGELCFRGYAVLQRYLGDPEATAKALGDDGWYRSGDLGRLHEGGFEYLARLGDSLRLRGFLVDPAEIERRLEQHPAVELAQVVGVDRPGIGQLAVAFIRTSDTPDSDLEAELRAFCAAGIADLKVPAHIVRIDEFPVVDGPNGAKILKRALREQAAQHVAGQ